jgi:hypothetical protein
MYCLFDSVLLLHFMLNKFVKSENKIRFLLFWNQVRPVFYQIWIHKFSWWYRDYSRLYNLAKKFVVVPNQCVFGSVLAGVDKHLETNEISLLKEEK